MGKKLDMGNVTERIEKLSSKKRALLELHLQKKAEVALEKTSDKIPSVTVPESERMVPLSYAQEALWILDQLDPGNTAYNMPGGIRIRGKLKVEVLERCLSEIIRRHEILRTNFEARDGVPVQVVREPKELTLEKVDLRGPDADDRERLMHELMNAEGQHRFDLSRDPLIRAKLLKLKEDEHVLLLTLHHIVFDGWSSGILVWEFIQLYAAFADDKESPLSELPIQYADYAVWQKTPSQTEIITQQLAYWREQLNGLNDSAWLPTRQFRPRGQTYVARQHSFSFSEELTQRLKIFSQKEQATLFMILLAGFKALLYRYTGAEDISIGVPATNRTRRETEALIGCFVNVLVLRSNFNGNLSFKDFSRKERQTIIDAYNHQDLPFSKLTQELQAGRKTDHNDLFQIFFNMSNFEQQISELDGLQLERTYFQEPGAKFDITLHAKEMGEKIHFNFVYDAELFDGELIRDVAVYFQAFMTELLASPEVPVSTIVLPQYRQHMESCISTPEGFSEYQRDQIEQSVASRVSQQARMHAGELAVKSSRYSWTYAMLDAAAERVAAKLAESTQKTGVRVGLLFDHDAPMVAAILGVLKAGHVYVPLHSSYPKLRLEFYLEDSGAEILIADQQNLACRNVQFSGPIICFDALQTMRSADVVPVVSPESAAYILYTSGSTGVPKGVLQNHRNLQHFIQVYTNNLKLSWKDRISLVAPYSCDAAVMDIFGALLNGARLCPKDLHQDEIVELAEWISREQITVFHCTPTVFRHFLSTNPGKELLRTVRLVVLGGEEVVKTDIALFKRFFNDDCVLVNGYGPTESTVSVQAFIRNMNDVCGHFIPIGHPVSETEIIFFDDHGKETPLCGEMGIRSEYVAVGYWRRDELTREKFLSADQKKRVYRTGDLGRRRLDGKLEFLGRKDSQVKIRGFRVELGEIESLVRSYPDIKAAKATICKSLNETSQIFVYVVIAEGARFEDEVLKRYLRERLPEYMVPRMIIRIDSLPLTKSGKIDIKRLPIPELERSVAEKIDPQTAVEKRIAEIWCEVLKLEKVGLNDNFFELGGHSLTATQVVTRLKAAFEMQLSLRVLFEAPTLVELAKKVEQASIAGTGDGSVDKAVKEFEVGII